MSDITYIGFIDYRNKRTRFGIKQNDRSGHIYCIGKTGVGKSTLLLRMAISDIENGNGIGIIDPHGDLSETLLDYIPESRIKDVIYFNATDREFPMAFNPLQNVEAANHYLVASAIISTFKKAWSESWGPRLEHILRNTILTLLQYPGANLLDIQPLLTDVNFRNEVLLNISDTVILSFWYKEFYAMSPALKAEAISPIINKIGLFQTHPLIRNIVSQKTSSFCIADVMNHKKIFIANLSKGALGEEGTQLLGSLLVTQFQTAAVGRTSQPLETRTPFYLYIDEMHSFVTLSFADILAESRKYGLSLFLTHQYIDQLHEKILAAILGNVGTLICFRIGASDAKVLEQEFKPILTSEDLVRLPRYGIYIKLLIDGTTSQPFSANTISLIEGIKNFKAKIIDHNRSKYCQERIDITKERLQPSSKNEDEHNKFPLTLF
ncbi:MAG: type IV secretion system DNA-binding domain-containing protein [Chitinophagaceae bacterium]|nr:type IV secretion system DNA-binding domain-containing protein [Chitinophagaceae bacterium]